MMFQRIAQYQLMEMEGRWYRPRAYGTRQPDEMWGGWLLFFPLTGGTAISSGRETTQSTVDALMVWASGLTEVYLEGALARALRIAQQPPLLARLAAAEYEALEDAERFEAAASIEQVAACVDEAAAATARGEAEWIRQQRLATEGALAATEEAAARLEAEAHEEAAQEARAVASDAARRRRRAEPESRPTPKSHRNAKRK
jgi:hypothetical protein